MRLADCEQIKNQDDDNFYPYELRLLSEADLPQIMALQEKVISSMDRNDYCVPLSEKEHLEMLDGRGEAVGVFIGARLVALCGILFPGDSENNMAYELNFSPEKLHSVAQLEISLVHPGFQGNDLQQKMAGFLVERAKNNQQYRYIFTTVSPYNYPSLQTVTTLGLFIAKVCKKYFGWDRYVVFRDFQKPIELDTVYAIAVSNIALEEQQALLECGYLGFSLLKGEDDIKVLFARKKETRTI